MVVHKNVVCPGCGSLCDDLQVTVEENKVTAVLRGCMLGRAKFIASPAGVSPRVAGQESSFKAALAAGARILATARHPLIYGLSSTTCEAQKKAVYLAEIIGASIDSTSSICHGPGTLAQQLVGIPTCSLGEVKNRADVVVFWGCNPMEAHPRHFSRYSVAARGLEVARGRKDRQVIVVDVRKTATAKGADLFLQVEPGGDFEVLTVLRALVKGHELPRATYGGIPWEQLVEVGEILRAASYGVLFFGMGLTMTRGGPYNVALAIDLVRDLNRHTKFAAMPMRGHGNVAGSESVLAWQTGYPFAVNFSRGYPRYNPGEFSATDLLRRREVDAALIVAADPVVTLPARAAACLKEIPTVVVDPYYSPTAQVAQVYFPSAPAGIGAAGTVYRMDLVPLSLKKLIEYPWPSDEEIISELVQGVSKCS